MSATTPLPVLDPTTMRAAGEVEVDASLAVPVPDLPDPAPIGVLEAMAAMGGQPEEFHTTTSGVCDPTEQPDAHAQRLPTPNDRPAIVDLVLARLRSPKARAVIEKRDAIGRVRYGTRLQAFNGRDVERDMTDEAADAVNYAMQGIQEAPDDAARARWERRFAMAEALLEECVGDGTARDEVERLRARVSGLEVDLAAMERRGDAHAEEPSWWRAELARALGLDADALPNSALVGHVHQMARDLAAICKAIETHLPESTRPVESYWLDRVANASAVIAGARASRDAYQQEARTAERRLTDERSARIEVVQRLERTEATLKRWQARARKAEARVTVLTEERDGLTLRLGQQERARMQASSTRPGTERRRTPTKAVPVAPAAPLRYRDRVRLTARGMSDPKLRRHPRGVFMGLAPADPEIIIVHRDGCKLSTATRGDLWERDDAKPARTRKGGRR